MEQKQLQNYSWSKPTINFYSLKNQRRMWCESYLERDALLRLEFQPNVTAYNTQPISFLYQDYDGQQHRYTPDQIVRVDNKHAFREVKRDKAADCPEFREEFSHVRTHIIGRYQTPLELIIESQIREGEFINNLKKLYGYKVVSLSPVQSINLKRVFGSECAFGEVRDYADKKQLSPTIPFALLSHGRFMCDLSLALNDEIVLEVV